MIGAGDYYRCLKSKKHPQGNWISRFNGVELLEGLPLKLATMDACRFEIGKIAAEIISNRVAGKKDTYDRITALKPKLDLGDTLKT